MTVSGKPPQVLLVAAFDSQLKWCAPLRTALESRGMVCTTVAPSDVSSALSDQQVADAGFAAVEPMSWAAIVRAAAGSDVVVCSLAGPLVQRLCRDLAALPLPAPGPVLVSGWVGIIIEKITAGYLDRAGTDVVAVNSGADLAHFSQVAAALGFPDDHLLLAGLPFLSTAPAPVRRSGPPRTVLWADQPTVPTSKAERRYVYERLIDYARRHPDREVLLKPRHRPGEDTFHRMKHHPADLLAGVDLPPNLRLDYTPITTLLERVDLLLTVSSTACLEAVDRGVRVALVADLGVHERYGNQVLIDSGLLRTFEQVGDDDLGTVSPAWRESYFAGRDRPPAEVVVDRVEKLLASEERPSRAVWDSSYVRGVWAARAAVGGSDGPPRRSRPVRLLIRLARRF
ncbi:hypothetical protein HMPREF0063_10932 [Aeromicrobium marinum DSM 15272]|uniref:CDP-glycerol:poly(Glycerophosphate) glycerophosphotransferase n=1 Tax=Aeromicrobium marinum DSM 15272 TaxID=585531 RepID=E2SAE2_9ACTN|nr:DUF6716 putative glycosyltransferase [Aeromicrobium marinum]EFQ84216.1 hypothetical protein HMPREF0063_10932 [Aeromicrobium marinum DSM 15272]